VNQYVKSNNLINSRNGSIMIEEETELKRELESLFPSDGLGRTS
jgi:hypothetical protein